MLGDKHVALWTPADLRRLVRALDDKTRQGVIKHAYAQNIWSTVKAACREAFSSKLDSLLVRSDNPSAGVQAPENGPKAVKQFLFPTEFLSVISCEESPLDWRRHVVLGVYLYARPGELRQLRWSDLDLEHGTVHVHRGTDEYGKEKPTKTKEARRFHFESTLAPLLMLMADEAVHDFLLPPSAREPGTLAQLHQHLLTAGVKRAALHDTSDTSNAIRYYDFRATGITWRAVRRDSPYEIMRHAGHRSFETTQGYIRTAYDVAEGFGEPFPELPAAVLGHRHAPTGTQLARKSCNPTESQRREWESNPR